MPFVLFGVDYGAVEIVTSKTSSTQDDNLNANDIFKRHDMINISSCIKQFKFIKPIKPKREEQQRDRDQVRNANQGYQEARRREDLGKRNQD